MPDLSQFAVAAFALVGLVNGVNFAFEKNWKSLAKFLLAVVAGAVLGFLKWFGLPNVETGLLLGIASSGAYKAVQLLSGQ